MIQLSTNLSDPLLDLLREDPTLVNALVGEERVIVGPEPGLTRDSIAIDWQWNTLATTSGMKFSSTATGLTSGTTGTPKVQFGTIARGRKRRCR